MRIGHYMRDLWKPGGISTYIQRLSAAQRDAGDSVVFLDVSPTHPSWIAAEDWQCVDDDAALFAAAAHLQLDVLHVHTLVAVPSVLTTPVLRTLHGHEPYCPSGGRFLERSGKPCSRNYSLLGCTWGHVVDRCGSLRPGVMRAGFARRSAEKRETSRLPVLTVSEYLRTQMLRAGYDAQRVHALALPAPPAVPGAVPPPRGTDERFVFLGRLTPHKGVDWLLEAAARVQQPIQVDIAGDGNVQEQLRDRAKHLGLENRVTFHGWVDSQQVARLLDASRALVFPSLWQEPAGLVCFEAAAHARAVIASRVGGIPEMVSDQRTGILVEPGDVAALAAAIERLAGDADLAQKLGQHAYESVPRQFAMGEHLQKLNDFYRQCILSKG